MMTDHTMPTPETEPVLRAVKEERRRQIDLGWTTNHDDEHDTAEFVELSKKYVHRAVLASSGTGGGVQVEWDSLVKAAALLVAALELIERDSVELPS